MSKSTMTVFDHGNDTLSGLPPLPIPLPPLHSAEPSTSDTLREIVSPTAGWKCPERKWMPDPRSKEPRRRTLVLLFDGTGDQFDDDNSNLVQMMSLLKKDDTSQQMVYYQPGIGTYAHANALGMGLRRISKTLDQMVAWSLGTHVREGYQFLMQNYTEGDKICIFGFSRGAYTARALAGMLQKVGLLPACNYQQLPFAYLMYTREDDEALRLCRDFKFTYSINVKIEFLGVWDTVASVGLVPTYLPFVGSNSSIRWFRHAIALDEHRVKFLPSYWKNSHDYEDDEEEERVRSAKEALLSLFSSDDAKVKSPATKRPKNLSHNKHSEVRMFEDDINRTTGMKTDSQEVWFAGVHTDVGGGSVKNHTRHSLARIPLRWMIRECFATNTGMIFDMDMLQDVVGLDVDFDRRVLKPAPERLSPEEARLNGNFHIIPDEPIPGLLKSTAWGVFNTVKAPVSLVGRALRRIILGKRSRVADVVHTAPPPPAHGRTVEASIQPFQGEAMEELLDSLSPMYDQLRIARWWWILEWMPVKVKKEKAEYEGTDRFADFTRIINNGEGRKVFKHVVDRGMKVHRSVLTRMEAVDHTGKPATYLPRVRPNVHIWEEDQEHKRCVRPSREEWLSGTFDGMNLKRPWFEWVNVVTKDGSA